MAALTPSTSFTQDPDDINAATVADTTSNYGGGNPVRSDAANYLLFAKLDENGNRTFVNPDFGDVITIMEWDVVTAISGWYQRILMTIQFYVGATAYVIEQSTGGVITQYASIVYYVGKVYKRINSPGSGNLPTDTAYWEEVTDLSTILSNTNIVATITDTYVRSHADVAVKNAFAEMTKNCACDDKINKKAYLFNGLLISADSQVQSGNYDEMEIIIRLLESKTSQS